jgi:hypothetical protein
VRGRTWLTRAVRAVSLATALVVGATGLLSASPATAATAVPPAPTPATKAFRTATVDAMPTWVRENGCSPTEKPGPQLLRRLLRTTYGPIASNIVRPCTAADSGHEEGRALDWMTNVRVPAQKAMADAFVAWVQAPDPSGNPEAMARRLGIAYLIWNNRTWRAYDPARGWTEYDGCLSPRKRKKKAFDNACHRTHVHISFTWDGALKRTSYASGYVACPPPAVPATPPWPTTPTTPTIPTVPVVPVPVVTPAPVTGPVVPLTPSRLLGTRTGIGTPAGPCRVHPDVRLDVPVLGRGGVPATGVAAVVLRVQLLSPDAVATLRAWPTDSLMPAGTVPLDTTGRVAQVTVPVGTTGAVSLQLGGAMAHLRVDVLGYVAAGLSVVGAT